MPALRPTILILVLAGLALPARADSVSSSTDPNAACRIPFEILLDPKTGAPFPLTAARNENEGLPDHLRGRYLVADLNSADLNGMCRGVQEHFAPVEDLTDFPRLRAIAASRNTDLASLAKQDLRLLLASLGQSEDAASLSIEIEDLKNHLEQVRRFATAPVVKARVYNGYCVGQTLNFCEIVNGQPTLMYRFITSSSRYPPKLGQYYAPINVIPSRSWSSDRPYTPADARRDTRLGGGSARIVPFENGGNPIEMPNFLHFVPAPGYVGERRNGIHEIAGGLDSGGTFGSPVSLGCIRLHKYPAKLARWWTPREAKFFIYFEPSRYRHFGHAATGKAK